MMNHAITVGDLVIVGAVGLGICGIILVVGLLLIRAVGGGE